MIVILYPFNVLVSTRRRSQTLMVTRNRLRLSRTDIRYQQTVRVLVWTIHSFNPFLWIRKPIPTHLRPYWPCCLAMHEGRTVTSYSVRKTRRCQPYQLYGRMLYTVLGTWCSMSVLLKNFGGLHRPVPICLTFAFDINLWVIILFFILNTLESL